MQEKLKHVHCDFFQPQILAFDMVCKTRSFSEAGKALGVSQSNISRRVLSLEKKFANRSQRSAVEADIRGTAFARPYP